LRLWEVFWAVLRFAVGKTKRENENEVENSNENKKENEEQKNTPMRRSKRLKWSLILTGKKLWLA
jgi:hypothetical protein